MDVYSRNINSGSSVRFATSGLATLLHKLETLKALDIDV